MTKQPPSPQLLASLAHWGAPVEAPPSSPWPLERSLVEGLLAARTNGSLLRLLPMVLAQHGEGLDPHLLRTQALAAGVGPEMAWLLEATGEAVGRPSLLGIGQGLSPAKPMRCFPMAPNPFAQRRIQAQASGLALRWGLWIAESEQDFKTLLGKHGILRRGA